MTIQEAITRVRELKPNQFQDDVLVGWLSDLDGLIWREVLCWHEGAPQEPPAAYSAQTDMEKELLVGQPYSDIYISYLNAKIDYTNGEFTRYNNSMVTYNMALSVFADAHNRQNLPKTGPYIRI